ncbi:MAG: hydrogenobyrinic acid a,c-diamide synthase (glutamine-hydrolyzing) [Gammaproteobacteria bacterium]|nr:hydrogenobyrinic acid a,c-diamide synthase (glutamine-hydrolyzing) [Gammaproteobacteria bacterium]
MSRLFISATRKSSGKTTVALGICAALVHRELAVQTFKKGPDYIDPMWLSRSSGRPCINLDFNTMCSDELLATLAYYQSLSDVSIIEGNKGLYDGVDTFGTDSNAALCKLTQTPVILVVDAEGSTRGVAPLILGYQQFDLEISIAGVIFNKTGGPRHETKLRGVMEQYTDVDVLGCIPKNTEMMLPERHLGLVTDKEMEIDVAAAYVAHTRQVVEDCVQIDSLVSLLSPKEPCPKARFSTEQEPNSRTQNLPALASIQNRKTVPASGAVRIGVAKDNAFCFYYQDDLDVMEECGAQIHFFDTLHDNALPDVDALFIGGGFPETHGKELENNSAMRSAIKAFAASGKPIYAECGGLMYLTREIRWKEEISEMVGVIPADTHMFKRPIGRGYVELVCDSAHPWGTSTLGSADQGSRLQDPAGKCSKQHWTEMVATGDVIKAHEFHYSKLVNIGSEVQYAYKVKRGHGIDGDRDGLMIDCVLANYAHMRHSRSNPWVSRFLYAVSKHKSQINKIECAETTSPFTTTHCKD